MQILLTKVFNLVRVIITGAAHISPQWESGIWSGDDYHWTVQGFHPAPQIAPTQHQAKHLSGGKAAFLGPEQVGCQNGNGILSPYVGTGTWIWTWPSSPVTQTWTWNGNRTCASVSYPQKEKGTWNRNETKISFVGEGSGSTIGYVCGIDHDPHTPWTWEQDKKYQQYKQQLREVSRDLVYPLAGGT